MVHITVGTMFFPCCCCSHINSHNQVRGHRTGPVTLELRNTPEKKKYERTNKPKVVHAYNPNPNPNPNPHNTLSVVCLDHGVAHLEQWHHRVIPKWNFCLILSAPLR